MGQLTINKPKCLIRFRGKTLLHWQIESLIKAGITEIGIVTGYRREQLGGLGLHEFYNPRWSSTNMVYSLTYASEWLLSDQCIVSYSDIFYESPAISSLMADNHSLSITYDPNWIRIWKLRFENPLEDAETFRISQEGKVLEIGERSNDIKTIQGQFMGLLKLTPESWSHILNQRRYLPKELQEKIDMTATLQHAIANNLGIHAIPYYGKWGELDSQQDIIALSDRDS